MSSRTLADVRNALDAARANGTLSRQHHKDMVSNGLDRLERLIRQPLATVAAHPAALDRYFGGIEKVWSLHFASRRAFENFRSRARRAVNQVAPAAPTTTPAAWPPTWRSLHNQLRAATSHGWLLPGFERISNRAVAQGLAPHEVTSAWFATELDGLKGRDREALRQARRSWNRAVTDHGLALAVIDKPAPRQSATSLAPWSSFPPTLEAEVDTFIAHIFANRAETNIDLASLSDDEIEALGATHPACVPHQRRQRPDRRPRDRYLQELKKYLLALANGLARHPRAPARIAHLTQIVKMNAYSGYCDYYREKRGKEKSDYLYCLGNITLMAANHCNVNQEIIKLLMQKRDAVRPDHHGTMAPNRQKTISALLNEPDAIIRYYSIPRILWSRGLRLIAAGKTPDGIVECECAIQIRLAQVLPMRRLNILGLRVFGANPTIFLPTSAQRCREITIDVPPPQTKAWKRIQARVPDAELARWLWSYVHARRQDLGDKSMRDFMIGRDYMPGSPCDYLFPGTAKAELPKEWAGLGEGYFRSTKSVCDRISRHTRELIGIEMTPHVLRHALAMIILKLRPDLKPILTDLLGDEMGTIEKFYTFDRTTLAVTAVLNLLNRNTVMPITVIEQLQSDIENV